MGSLRSLRAFHAAKAGLSRAGVWRPLARAWQLARDPRAWVAHRAAVEADYRAFAQHEPLTGSATGGLRRALLVSLSDWIAQAKTEALLGSALRRRGIEPVVLTYPWCRTAHRYFRAAGLTAFVSMDEPEWLRPSAEIRRTAEQLLAANPTIQTLKAFTYRGAYVGRQVLASISRRLHRSVDLGDAEVRELLALWLPQAMAGVAEAERILDAQRPEILIFLEKDYIGLGALYDLALNRGLTVIQWCASQRDDGYTLKRYTPATRHVHPQSISDATWARIQETPWTAAMDEALQQDVLDRYVDAKWTSYYNRPTGRLKEAQALKHELGLDPAKKTAIVFSHVLWDSTFFWGEDVFNDYTEWLVETVRAACRNTQVNWVIKLHPANAWKLARDGVRGELYDRTVLRERIGALPPHIRVLDPDADVNPYSLFDVADACLTVRGTIGIEMACAGIPVLTAGTGRYSGRGFTIDSTSQEEYANRLARIQELPRLSPEQVGLAKRYAYALFVVRPWRVSSFAQTYLPVRQGGHPLDHNVALHAPSWRELATSPDLQAFAAWAAESQDEDFLDPALGAPLRAASCASSI